MLPTITDEGRAALDSLLKDVIDNRKLPALFLTACNADQVIYENQDGWVDFDDEGGKRVDAATALHLFSMSKLVTSIAVHHLVDSGLATLHDADLVGRFLPEIALGKLELLEGWDEERDEPIMRKATKGITLAHLMSHSAGFCYPHNGPPMLETWLKKNPRKGLFEAGASIQDYILPVIYEPGESYHYSIGLDWAGFFIERRTGMSLEAYFKKHIFEPLGITDISFYPRPDILERLMKPCALVGDKLTVLPPKPMGKPLKVEEVTVLNGGGGLYGTTRDYLKILQGILRSAPSYQGPNKPLLSPESFKTLFTGVLTSQGLQELDKVLMSMWYQTPSGAVQHSPGMLIYVDEGKLGRKAGSGCWDGAMKTIFWIDPETGVAAECNTNILSSNNDNASGHTLRAFEKALYDGLRT